MWRIAVMVVLALAACSGGDKGGSNSSGAAASGGRTQEESGNATADPQTMMVPVQTPSPTPLAAIPASFQGRWGVVEDDCDPAKSATAKGLMTVSGNRLTFYESRGSVAGLRQLAPGSIGFDLSMNGEVSTRSEATRMTLQDDGRTLIRQVTGSPDRASGSTYQRCPA